MRVVQGFLSCRCSFDDPVSPEIVSNHAGNDRATTEFIWLNNGGTCFVDRRRLTAGD